MPINQANKPVNCISCGRLIAKGSIQEGAIEILCRCGVKNRIVAENKPEGRVTRESVVMRFNEVDGHGDIYLPDSVKFKS